MPTLEELGYVVFDPSIPSRKFKYAPWKCYLCEGKGCKDCDTLRAREAVKQLESARKELARCRLPSWPWATPSNERWRRQIDPRLPGLYARWDGSTSLLVLGDTGCGKSSALCLRLEEIQDHWLDEIRKEPRFHVPGMVWTSESRLLEDKRRSKLGEAPAGTLGQQGVQGPFVIDECGFTEPASVPLILGIVSARYNFELPTVITSGLTLAQFSARYGDAVVRKLVENHTLIDLYQEPSPSPRARWGQSTQPSP